MVIGTWLGLPNLATVVLSIVLAFVFGYALTVRGVLRSGLDLRSALKVALAADTASIAVMELIDNAVVLAVPGAMDAGLTSWLFWGALAFSLAVAFVVTTPFDKWMIARQGSCGGARLPLSAGHAGLWTGAGVTPARHTLCGWLPTSTLCSRRRWPGVEGTERPGQVEMAHAVADAVATGRAPPRAGGHRHRQVAGLPRAGGPARHGVRQARGRGHGHAGAAGPDRRPRHAAGRGGPGARCSGDDRPTRWSRAGATTCARTSWRAGSPTRRTRCSAVDQVSATASRLGRRGGPAARVGRGSTASGRP